MKRILLSIMMLLALLLPHSPALAEDVLCLTPSDYASADVEDAQYRAAHLTMTTSYVCFTGDLAEEGNVSLTITREDTQETVYARDYGSVLGSFRTEDIYLRLDSAKQTYRVQLFCGNDVYSFPIDRVMPRLVDNAACSVGYPLAELNGKDMWQSATLLDVAAMEGTSCTYDLIASKRYLLGTVTFTVSNNAISTHVDLLPEAEAEITSATVYVASTALEAETLGRKRCTAASGDLDEFTPCSTNLAAVYVKLKVSFQPAALSAPAPLADDTQSLLWQRMKEETLSEANG